MTKYYEPEGEEVTCEDLQRMAAEVKFFDLVWFFCQCCQEEYEFPENQEVCAVCGHDHLELL